MRLPRRPSDRFHCEPLHAVLEARVCVLRQQACEGHRIRDRWRGQSALYPTARACPLGRAVDSLAPFRQEERRRQLVARRRVQRAGLLERVPDLDEPSEESEELDRDQREREAPWW
jgi:hypothetical protein